MQSKKENLKPLSTGNPLTSQSSHQDSLKQKFPIVWQKLQTKYKLSIEEMTTIQQNMNKDSVNFAFGSMFGAFIGDALGAYCQFTSKSFQEQHPILNQAMKMPGKGTFNIKAGQFTDDSELASHMLEALCSYNVQKSFENQSLSLLMQIVRQYVTWFKSQPFDIGGTTTNALRILNNNLFEMKCDKQEGQEINEAQKLKCMHTKVEVKNKQSMSNGSLMRITPMAFFISLLLQQQEYNDLKCADFRSFIMSQINMTHGNSEIFESSYAYVELLVDVILRKTNKKSLKQIYESFIEKYKNNKSISQWINDALKQEQMDATVHQGWALIAFTYGIKSLKTLVELKEEDLTEQNYVKIMKKVIGKAGDSDTNAAIVGGLVGAVLGFKRLPTIYLNKQFSLRLNEEDSQCSFRGPFYEPIQQFYKAMKLVQKFNY